MATQTDNIDIMRRHAMEIFQAALKAVDPVEAILRRITSYNVCYTKLLRGVPSGAVSCLFIGCN